jgi:hypothetical protein
LDADPLPDQAEPLGGLLALLGALFDDEIRALYANGGLASFRSLLDSPFCYLPHDTITPGALTAGDLGDIAASLAPRPMRLDGLVNGLNQEVSAGTLAKTFDSARKAYRSGGVEDRLLLEAGTKGSESVPHWLLRQLSAN